MKTVLYKGVHLANGSRGYELYLSKNAKELDTLIRECEAKEKNLIERYRKKTEVEINSDYLKECLK